MHLVGVRQETFAVFGGTVGPFAFLALLSGIGDNEAVVEGFAADWLFSSQ